MGKYWNRFYPIASALIISPQKVYHWQFFTLGMKLYSNIKRDGVAGQKSHLSYGYGHRASDLSLALYHPPIASVDQSERDSRSEMARMGATLDQRSAPPAVSPSPLSPARIMKSECCQN